MKIDFVVRCYLFRHENSSIFPDMVNSFSAENYYCGEYFEVIWRYEVYANLEKTKRKEVSNTI